MFKLITILLSMLQVVAQKTWFEWMDNHVSVDNDHVYFTSTFCEIWHGEDPPDTWPQECPQQPIATHRIDLNLCAANENGAIAAADHGNFGASCKDCTVTHGYWGLELHCSCSEGNGYWNNTMVGVEGVIWFIYNPLDDDPSQSSPMLKCFDHESEKIS
ncbi:hypothetical protein GGR57DRAFT_458770 [Xylariaceae sp. FL1272]|nr:hypothetical protein GGR57DRAFT_458770 [Xylariaceae sp. FL1272]